MSVDRVDQEQGPNAPVHPGLFSPAGLIGGRCAQCGDRHFPRAEICPWCGHDDVSEVVLSTRGRLWAWTSVSTAPPGYDGDLPYGFGVVELGADQLRVVTRLVEPDPSVMRAGMPMEFMVVPLGDGSTTWAYRPA